MDRQRFKQLLVRDKLWLQELYSTSSEPTRKRLVISASDKKIDTLLKFLHLLSNGEIKMHKEDFESLNKKQVAILKKNFESKAGIKRLINSERQDKLKKISKLMCVLPFLLRTLFN